MLPCLEAPEQANCGRPRTEIIPIASLEFNESSNRSMTTKCAHRFLQRPSKTKGIVVHCQSSECSV